MNVRGETRYVFNPKESTMADCTKCGKTFKEGDTIIELQKGTWSLTVEAPEEAEGEFIFEEVVSQLHEDCVPADVAQEA